MTTIVAVRAWPRRLAVRCPPAVDAFSVSAASLLDDHSVLRGQATSDSSPCSLYAAESLGFSPRSSAASFVSLTPAARAALKRSRISAPRRLEHEPELLAPRHGVDLHDEDSALNLLTDESQLA